MTFSALLALCGAIHRSPVNSPHKAQLRGALLFYFICAWINGWVNNCDAGDFRSRYVHYDVTVMYMQSRVCTFSRNASLLMLLIQFTLLSIYSHSLKSSQWSHESTIASQITVNSTVCLAICSGSQQRKHRSPPYYWTFKSGIRRWQMELPHRVSVMRKTVPLNDALMGAKQTHQSAMYLRVSSFQTQIRARKKYKCRIWYVTIHCIPYSE